MMPIKILLATHQLKPKIFMLQSLLTKITLKPRNTMFINQIFQETQ